MKARMMTEREYTWEQIEEILAAGKAPEVFGDAGEIDVHVEDIGTVTLSILDYDREKLAAGETMHTMTLQFKNAMEERAFDEDTNDWEQSDIRKYLNGPEFVNKFEEGFRKMLVPVVKENGRNPETIDIFFLLSYDEMKNEDKKYKRFRTKGDCAKVDSTGDTTWHWTRSANGSNANYVMSVNTSGYVSLAHAWYSYAYAPACVIATAIK